MFEKAEIGGVPDRFVSCRSTLVGCLTWCAAWHRISTKVRPGNCVTCLYRKPLLNVATATVRPSCPRVAGCRGALLKKRLV